MSQPRRLWVDMSYTRTQQGSIGITRTVRRLFEEFQVLATACEPVAFHGTGFRAIGAAASARATSGRPSAFADRLFRWVNGGLMRRLVSWALRIVPWALLRPAWEWSSTQTFNALTRLAPPAAFLPGDVVWLADASWNYPAWKAARRARARGAKVVLMVHDLMPLRHPEFCFPLVPRLYRMWLLEMMGCSDAVICNSRATEQDLRSWLASQPDAPPPPAIGHFRLGSDPAPQVADGEVRETIARFLDGSVPCFAAVGSFEPKKNHRLLLDVLGPLWARGSAARLLLVGKMTTDWPELAQTLRDHPERGKRLLAVHDASDAELLRVYMACRALLLPSLFEGFGLPLVEARARGCPVIATDLPAFAELADDGVFLFDPRAPGALEALLLQHCARDMRADAPPMPPFTWRDSARQCLDRMSQLLGDRVPGAPPPARQPGEVGI